MKTDGTMIDEDSLYDLAAADGPTTIRPLSEITSRATVLRRRRRVTMTGAVAAAAVLAVAAAGLNLIGADPSARRIAQPAKQSGAPAKAKDCSLAFSSVLRPAEVPDVLYLPPLSVTGPIAYRPTLRRGNPNCDRPLIQASWYATKNGQVTRTLDLTGPNSPNEYLNPNGPSMGVDPVAVDVRGAPGTLYYSSSGLGRLFWTAKDGSQWAAQFDDDVSRAHGLKAVRSLVIDGNHLPASQTPYGYPHTQPVFTSGFDQSRNAMMDVSFGTGNGDNGGWDFRVNRPLKGNVQPWPGGQRVDINGSTGWWSNNGRSDYNHQTMGSLSWTLPNGSLGWIDGTITKQKALLVARCAVQVPPNDPRWTDPAKH